MEDTEQQPYKISDPEGPKVKGKIKEFHDGAGLASPGRWDVEQRCWNKEQWIVNLRSELLCIIVEKCGGYNKFDKVCFAMAIKGEVGCELVKDEPLKGALLNKMVESLKERGVDTEELLQIADGQPFRLIDFCRPCCNSWGIQITFFFWMERLAFRWGSFIHYLVRHTCTKGRHLGKRKMILI